MRKTIILLSLAVCAICATTASAQQKFNAFLNGAQQVTSVNTPAAGTGVVTLNTAQNEITVTLTYSGLTGDAFAAHIHGTAGIGQNAPVLFNFQGVSGTSNTVTGVFSVTPQDVGALRSGRFYFNVHTPNFPNGEIRGQIQSVKINDDFDGDGRSDLKVLRTAPPTASYTDVFIQNSFDNSVVMRRIPFVVDQSICGDFNGDGLDDLDAIRIDPATGNYTHYLYNLNDPAGNPGTMTDPTLLRIIQWGSNNLGDTPVGGDYDGDGKADTVVYRKTTGTWYILQSSNNQLRAEQFGISTDIPAPSDYDKDGKDDLAVVRDVNGQFVWFIKQSSTNTLRYVYWGTSATDSVLNKFFFIDLDGDGAADPSVVRKELDGTRVIYGLNSLNSSLFAAQWGLRADRTAIGDADGDGRSDLISIRQIPENQDGAPFTWYLRQSSTNTARIVNFGQGTDAVVAIF